MFLIYLFVETPPRAISPSLLPTQDTTLPKAVNHTPYGDKIVGIEELAVDLEDKINQLHHPPTSKTSTTKSGQKHITEPESMGNGVRETKFDTTKESAKFGASNVIDNSLPATKDASSKQTKKSNRDKSSKAQADSVYDRSRLPRKARDNKKSSQSPYNRQKSGISSKSPDDPPTPGRHRKKKLPILSDSSEEDRELPSNTKRGAKHKNNAASVRGQKLKWRQHKLKDCKVRADKLLVPDHFVYGAIVKKNVSRKSCHPYIVRKWLASDSDELPNRDGLKPPQSKRSVLGGSGCKNKPCEKRKLSPILLMDALEETLFDGSPPRIDNHEKEQLEKGNEHKTKGKFLSSYNTYRKTIGKMQKGQNETLPTFLLLHYSYSNIDIVKSSHP